MESKEPSVFTSTYSEGIQRVLQEINIFQQAKARYCWFEPAVSWLQPTRSAHDLPISFAELKLSSLIMISKLHHETKTTFCVQNCIMRATLYTVMSTLSSVHHECKTMSCVQPHIMQAILNHACNATSCLQNYVMRATLHPYVQQ